MDNCILLRYGEIGLKSKGTRRHWEKLYVEAIADALKRNNIKDCQIKNFGGRFVVYSKEIEKAVHVLQRVPGIQSLSPANYFEFKEKEDLLQKIGNLANSSVQEKTFCVRVNRIGKHNFTSKDLEKEAGSVLYEKAKGVNLSHPEIIINLEIRGQQCFLYSATKKGVGGLPPRSSGKVLCLFSGGIDSPVAAFQMLKRGCAVDFLFINLLGEKALADTAQVYNFLTQQFTFGYIPKFYEIDGKEFVKKIKQEVPDKIRQIALKIAFYQIAELMAKKQKYPALVTGESLSQKSSQTLQSLSLIESQVKISIIRPLICFDKIEITKLAQDIGTFASSEKVKEYCNLSEGPVATAPKETVLEKIPSFKDIIIKITDKIIVTRGIVKIEEDSSVDFSSDVITVDIRSDNEKKINTDLSIPYPQVLGELERFERNKNYLLICQFGVQSENVAFLLRKRGIKAAGMSLANYLKKLK